MTGATLGDSVLQHSVQHEQQAGDGIRAPDRAGLDQAWDVDKRHPLDPFRLVPVGRLTDLHDLMG